MITEVSPCSILFPGGGTLNRFIDNHTCKPYSDVDFVPTQISHEVPMRMLEMSRSFNDYDYALVHLFKDNPNYFNFFVQSVAMGRKVILDNSLYELGEAFDMKEYHRWINALHPTHYIIPDTFWNTDATIQQAMRWMTEYGNAIDKSINKIGVAQGATYADIKRAYKFMSSFCDCIAFTFKFSPDMLVDPELNLSEFLDELTVRFPGVGLSGSDLTMEDKQAACRYLILKKLDEEGVIDHTKEHHLLGLQNTTLLYESCRFPWVTSIDTSNPIINGFCGNMYYFNNTIIGKSEPHAFVGNSGHPKPITQLKDYFYSDVRGEVLDDIMHNVRSFREVVNPSYLSTIYKGKRVMNDEYMAENVREFIANKFNN